MISNVMKTMGVFQWYSSALQRTRVAAAIATLHLKCRYAVLVEEPAAKIFGCAGNLVHGLKQYDTFGRHLQ